MIFQLFFFHNNKKYCYNNILLIKICGRLESKCGTYCNCFVLPAEWDYRSQRNGSMTPSQTRKVAELSNHRPDNHTDHSRSQVSAYELDQKY